MQELEPVLVLSTDPEEEIAPEICLVSLDMVFVGEPTISLPVRRTAKRVASWHRQRRPCKR
jgi:hypothetical protein